MVGCRSPLLIIHAVCKAFWCGDRGWKGEGLSRALDNHCSPLLLVPILRRKRFDRESKIHFQICSLFPLDSVNRLTVETVHSLKCGECQIPPVSASHTHQQCKLEQGAGHEPRLFCHIPTQSSCLHGLTQICCSRVLPDTPGHPGLVKDPPDVAGVDWCSVPLSELHQEPTKTANELGFSTTKHTWFPFSSEAAMLQGLACLLQAQVMGTSGLCIFMWICDVMW